MVRTICMLLIAAGIIHADISNRPVIIRLPPQNRKPNFMKEMLPPHPIQSPVTSANRPQRTHLGNHPLLTPAAQLPVITPVSLCLLDEVLYISNSLFKFCTWFSKFKLLVDLDLNLLAELLYNHVYIFTSRYEASQTVEL